MASSDSSEDENAALIRESVDTSLFNDNMFKDLSKKKSDKVVKIQDQPKSQRYLPNEELQVDLRITATMQSHIGEKVSQIINSKIKFVDVKSKEQPNDQVEGGVKLFNNSKKFLTLDLPEEVLLTKEKRKKIRKRKMEEEVEVSKDEMVSQVAVSPEDILSKADTAHWLSRQKPKMFKYKSSKNNKVLELISEP